MILTNEDKERILHGLIMYRNNIYESETKLPCKHSHLKNISDLMYKEADETLKLISKIENNKNDKMVI